MASFFSLGEVVTEITPTPDNFSGLKNVLVNKKLFGKSLGMEAKDTRKTNGWMMWYSYNVSYFNYHTVFVSKYYKLKSITYDYPLISLTHHLYNPQFQVASTL